MASILSLFGTILIDNTQANQSLDTTTQKAEQSGSRVGSAFGTIVKGAAAVGTAVVAGAAAVGTAAYKMATDTAATADSIDKNAQRVGLARDTYQEYAYVLSQNGSSIENMGSAFKKLTTNIGNAVDGSSSAIEAFTQLGITEEQLQTLSREDIFNLTIQRMQEMGDTTERANLATQLFGRSGQELAPLLNSTAEETENLRQKAHELGMVMSDDAIDAGVELTDSLDTVKRSFRGALNSLGTVVMPLLTTILNLIIDKVPMIQAFITRLSPVVESLFSGVLPPLFELAEALLPVAFELLEALLPVLQEMISSILPVIISLIQQLMPFAVEIVQQILPIITQLLTGLMPIFTQLISAILPPIIQILQALLPPLLQIINAILPVVLQLINTLIQPLLQIVNAIMPLIISLINAVMPLLVQIINAILPVITSLLDALLPFLMEILDTILPILIDLINTLIPIVVQIIDAILPVLMSLLDALMPLIQPILDILMTLLRPLTDLLKELLPPIMSLMTKIMNTILPPLTQALQLCAGAIGDALGGALSSVTDIANNIVNVFKNIIDFVKNVFTGNWKAAWQNVKNIFANVFEGLKTAFKLPINYIIDGINSFIKGLNKIKIPDWVPGVGGRSFHLNQISRLRVGMEYVPYDEFPALLHKGERVLTEEENKEYSKKPEENENKTINVNITLGEKSVYIERLDGTKAEDMDKFVDTLLELIDEKIKRKGAVFA